MAGVSPGVLLLFIAAVATQLLALGLMPRTAGFTDPVTTIECSVAFVVSVGLLARVLSSGVDLGILVPLMSCISPLGSIVIGVVVYGEKTSLLRLGLLCGACVLVAIASRVA